MIVTLQVRTLPVLPLSPLVIHRVKKAYLSASLTLEAAIVLTLFIFASVCLILPMKIMITERRIQSALEETAEELSRYAYPGNALSKGLNDLIPGADTSDMDFCGFLGNSAGKAYVLTDVEKRLDTASVISLDLSGSEIFTDGEFIDIVLDYKVRFPFSVLGISDLKRTARCRRRAWVGLPGKNYNADGSLGPDDDPIVYVGKTSTRYHLRRTCHYLSNDLTAVSIDQVGDLRNNSGGKYRPCASCGKAAASVVYIMPSGTSYHTDVDCKAIISYARAVRLSEVAYLGACSYCGK